MPMLMPLDVLRSGEWADVAEVSPATRAWVGRLAELGIRQGCRLQVLQPGSPCLLQVADCKLCLRGDDGAQILVRPVKA